MKAVVNSLRKWHVVHEHILVFSPEANVSLFEASCKSSPEDNTKIALFYCLLKDVSSFKVFYYSFIF